MSIRNILVGVAGFFMFFLTAAPLPAEITGAEISGPFLEASVEASSPDFPFLTAAQSVFLPIVFKAPSSGVLAVLINHFLLFVPPPAS
ncbi:MAG: hypothetical protein HY892_18325 [Deltaproteobacteria bacterium]|nr:hypothetical protein [Deltaproteobacteria bacterium]